MRLSTFALLMLCAFGRLDYAHAHDYRVGLSEVWCVGLEEGDLVGFHRYGRRSLSQEASDWNAEVARRATEATQARERKRLELADKLVMVLVDRIVADLIRPGPKPEERECYEMAQELRDMAPMLRELVVQVLDIEKPA